MTFTNDANEAYDRGVEDGTITDTIAHIIEIILEQDIVSYCSKHGTYSFDYEDLTGDDV